MTHEESDFEPDAFLDRQPVKFIADGGRNAVELRNPQDQPRSRVQDKLKLVEKIYIRPVEDTVTMIDSACDEGVHECQQGPPSLTTGEPFSNVADESSRLGRACSPGAP